MSFPPIRVLVVDDSAFARKVVREVLSGTADLEVVGIARDGRDALDKIARLSPDVVTLDLVMPNLDGVGVLRALASVPNRPAVVVVSTTDEDSELGVTALGLGAFEIVRKPTAVATDRLYELQDVLRTTVRMAGRRGRIGRAGAPALAPTSASTLPRATSTAPLAATSAVRRTRLLAIGASTGGPQALTSMMRALPATFPVPIAIVLHMPPGYTEVFARRLDTESALDVVEARDGMALRPGLVMVARAGMHLTFVSGPDGVMAKLDVSPLNALHRPSIDVMFASAAAHFGAGTLGVVLTGMGKDGLAGSRAICDAGGRVLTETEGSCVVYGMPRVVKEAGLSTAATSIDLMPTLITQNL